jgi:hypothetical protein
MQAKDVSDDAVLASVREARLQRARDHEVDVAWAAASRWDVEAALPHIPPKVLRAKLRSLVKRGLIEGCACGCRGDFVVTQPPGGED